MTRGSIPELCYNFGDLKLDQHSLRTFRGEEEIELPPLSARLLRALVRRAPGTLSLDEIAEEVWGGRYVSPRTITQRVKLLRRSLGDNADDPRYIALVRGVGYRLIPAVEVVPARYPRRRGRLHRPSSQAGIT